MRGQVLPVDVASSDERSRWFSETGEGALLRETSFCDRSCLEAPSGPGMHRGCAASAVDGRLWGHRWEASRRRRGVAGYTEPDGHIGAMRRHQLEPRNSVVALKAPDGRNAHPVLAADCTPCRIRRLHNGAWRIGCGSFIEAEPALVGPSGDRSRSPLAGSLAMRVGTAGDPAQQAAQDVGAGDDAWIVTPEQDHVVVDDVVLAA